MEMKMLKEQGRKFVVFQEIVVLTILYGIICIVKPSLTDISNVIMAVIAAGASYMGANALKEKYKK